MNTTLLKRRRTKIVATLGPASSDLDVLDRMIRAGVNVFRLNMAHGDHAIHQIACERVRATAAQIGEPVALLADLGGPKIRVGRFAEGQINLAPAAKVTVTTRDVLGGPGLIPSQYEGLVDDVYPGDHILLDDGKIELQVEEVAGTDILCTVLDGGVLKDRKGMNLPGVNVSAPSLTDKDCEDARFVMGLGVDFLAMSFVRQAADVVKLKNLIAEAGQSTHVIAKIEMPQALEDIEEILAVSDGIMVARGDLGVELPRETVPVAQRRLLARARAAGLPAIVATQMLESMIDNPRPTRAEVSDVSTAVFGEADAVMLSAETASGQYPLAAVEMMDRVVRQVEGCLWDEGAFESRLRDTHDRQLPLPLHDAVARAIGQLSRDLRVRAIVVTSASGQTAQVVAAARPAAPVLALAGDRAVCRRMNLLWGVVPVYINAGDHPHSLARRLARDFNLAAENEYVLAVAGLGGNPTENAPNLAVLRT
jgi:pyruvate kinase